MSRQTEIPGTEQVKNPDIEQAIDLWLEAKSEQRYASEKTKLRHASLLLQMANVGCEAYPFVEPDTGKKKLLVIARDPKAKATKQPKWNRRDGDAQDDVGEEVTVQVTDDPPVDNVVEMRRVKRTAAHDALVDPFASTRAAMDEDAAHFDQADRVEMEPVTEPKKKSKRGK
jgi:hypothetical protein